MTQTKTHKNALKLIMLSPSGQNEQILYLWKPCFPGPIMNFYPIHENDFERQIFWCKNPKDTTNTLEMAEV